MFKSWVFISHALVANLMNRYHLGDQPQSWM